MEPGKESESGSKSPRLRLKNGTEVDARSAYVHWKMLEAMQNKDARHLEAMLAMAQEGARGIPPKFRAEVQRRYRGWFEPGGELMDVAKNVLLSAYREGPDGPVLVNPFQLTTQAECEALDAIERQSDDVLRRLFRGRRGPPHRDR